MHRVVFSNVLNKIIMAEENNKRNDQQDRDRREENDKDTAENHGQNALRNESNDPGDEDVPTSEKKLQEEEREKGNQE